MYLKLFLKNNYFCIKFIKVWLTEGEARNSEKLSTEDSRSSVVSERHWSLHTWTRTVSQLQISLSSNTPTQGQLGTILYLIDWNAIMEWSWYCLCVWSKGLVHSQRFSVLMVVAWLTAEWWVHTENDLRFFPILTLLKDYKSSMINPTFPFSILAYSVL